MASSSSQRGAAPTPPAPDQLAAFYKLVDKKAIAGMLSRHARNAELSASAAASAEALFGDDSLVVASLRMDESKSSNNLTLEASGAEQEALLRRSWAALFSILPLLLRRINAKTLLPGTIREEELTYYAHLQAACWKAMNKPVPPPAALRSAVTTVGTSLFWMPCFGAWTWCGCRCGQPPRKELWSRLCSKGWTSSLSQPAYRHT